MPTWPGLVEIPPLPAGQFPLFTAVRTTASDFKNPRITTTSVALEQQLAPDWSFYFDYTYSRGDQLSQFLNINTAGRGAPFGPQLSDVFVHTSNAWSRYSGATFAVRKRFSDGYQLEANYVLSTDKDTDSSERDPFTDRSFDVPLTELDRLYASSDRDIRHKFNLFCVRQSAGRHRRQLSGPGARRRSRSRRRQARPTRATARGRTTSSSPSTGGSRGRSGSATATS